MICNRISIFLGKIWEEKGDTFHKLDVIFVSYLFLDKKKQKKKLEFMKHFFCNHRFIHFELLMYD